MTEKIRTERPDKAGEFQFIDDDLAHIDRRVPFCNYPDPHEAPSGWWILPGVLLGFVIFGMAVAWMALH
ncbi:hypothetical protein FHS78_000674 [Parvibaculum indicum]|uniref:hypothetical protein n=1 Tax=Parvibaculum indicum TaxID=562969 RepID=UPI001421896F|nr:hypothetical protein [Parvibaculum indicum]NIJ40404.1 hypothetical protein [Parvibaculum indicum]